MLTLHKSKWRVHECSIVGALFSVLSASLKYFMSFFFKALGVKDMVMISTYQPALSTRTADTAQNISVPKKKKKRKEKARK